MKINGFEYNQLEVFEALREKGYAIIPFQNYHEEHIHGSTFIQHWYWTFCAIKNNDELCEQNEWQNVAIREFQKEFVKPKLV